MIFKVLSYFCLIVFVIVTMPGSAEAASVILSGPANITVSSTTQLEVVVRIDSEDEVINAISGSLLFPSDALALQSIRDGDSIVGFWIESPHDLPYTNLLRSVNFSGTIPGGYKGNGKLFSLVFLVLDKPGQTKISTTNLVTLKHDGRGTVLNTSSTPLDLSIVKSFGNKIDSNEVKQIEPLFDTSAPLSLEVSVIKNQDLYSNAWTAVFFTVDAESGIDHYEVQESKSSSIDESAWKIVTSPYLLQDQTRESYIHIKAVNRIGLTTISTVGPSVKIAQPVDITIAKVGIFILVLVGLIFTVLLIRKWYYAKARVNIN